MNINRNKIEEVLAASKLNDLIHKKEEEEKQCKTILIILALEQSQQLQQSHMQYIVSLPRIILKISRKILKMTSMMISLMKMIRRR